MKNYSKPKAFISCSVRPEDQAFNKAVERVVKRYGFEPTGTVGLHVNYAEPIPVSMEKEIEVCDILVVAASPRYLQSEIKSDTKPSYAIPEMLHVESAMAYKAKKPIVAFVQQGVNVGGFLPHITQYFTVDSKTYKVHSKRQLKPFFNDLHVRVEKSIKGKDKESFGWFTIFGLAAIGLYTVVKNLFFKSEE